jgi:hypothetical protein
MKNTRDVLTHGKANNTEQHYIVTLLWLTKLPFRRVSPLIHKHHNKVECQNREYQSALLSKSA